MKTPELIQNAIASLNDAIKELEAKQSSLWEESDKIKAEGGDWVPTNHAGNECSHAAYILKSYTNSLAVNVAHIPKMIEKHKI